MLISGSVVRLSISRSISKLGSMRTGNNDTRIVSRIAHHVSSELLIYFNRADEGLRSFSKGLA